MIRWYKLGEDGKTPLPEGRGVMKRVTLVDVFAAVCMVLVTIAILSLYVFFAGVWLEFVQ